MEHLLGLRLCGRSCGAAAEEEDKAVTEDVAVAEDEADVAEVDVEGGKYSGRRSGGM